MKPLKLAFSGLHSYRQEQQIDFAELAGYGLFGIFGPTGAGKSTILDAITLALFGNVERAERGKRGILNQQEDRLQVSFTFEIGGKIYRVERQYTREGSDPFSLRARYARLLALDGAGKITEVIASTPSEVDSQIIKVLGLRKEDFTRAVVLPQGKFDEFLKLSGGERAKMLEYIFCLEPYGEELAEKAKKVLGHCEQRLANIAAEEAGMGDASEQAVAAARGAVQEEERILRDREKECSAVRQQWEQMEELRKQYEKLQQAKNKMYVLQAELPAMEKCRRELELATKAEPLRQDLTREQELALELRECGKLLEQARLLEKESEARWRRVQEQLEQAEREKEKERPLWEDRLLKVKGAVERAAERTKLLEELKKQEMALEELRKSMALVSAKLEDKRNYVAELRGRQKELTDLWLSMTIPPEEKDRLENAARILSLLEDREKQAVLWEKKYREGRLRLQKEFQSLVQLVRKRLPGAAFTPETDMGLLVEGVIKEVEEKIDSLRLAREQILLTQQAVALAAVLRAGEPCPVCGSREHPRPARTGENSAKLEALTRELEKAEKELAEARQWREEVLRANRALEVLYRTLEENILPERDRLQAEITDLAATFSRLAGGQSREQILRLLEQMRQAEKQLAELGRHRNRLEKEIEEIEAQVRELEEQVQSLQIKESALKVEMSFRRAREAELQEAIRRVAGDRDPAVLQRAIEQKMADLESRINQYRREKDAAWAELTEAQKRVTALESRLITLQREEEELKRRIEQKLVVAGFDTRSSALSALRDEEERRALAIRLEDFEHRLYAVGQEIRELEEALDGRPFDPAAWESLKVRMEELERDLQTHRARLAVRQNELERLEKNHRRWLALQEEKQKVARRRELADTLRRLLSGRKFVEFLAEEQLKAMALEASRRLGSLTGQRYALELDDKNEFILRDDFNGGQRRPVSTLSGGETFLASLSLALALSAQLQLKGRYPLGFFFLDEGFGTLDAEKLEVVMQSLEKLRLGECLVGVISHVRELRERMPVYLEVIPPGPDGSGSRVRLVRN
ncbi:MAG: AAA family ATPase [Moorellaceae bacterium]